MDTARISALLAPFLETPLAESQLKQISTYIDLLQRWNARINLTAIRNPEEIVTRHFGESLFLAGHVFPSPGQILSTAPTRVVDIGSGAGFPALPLKIWAPSIDLTLIESNHKKAAFLSEVSRELTFTNINITAERAETIAARSEGPSFDGPKFDGPEFDGPRFDGPRFDAATFRAVEHFDKVLQLATGFLVPGGRLAILVGASQLPRIQSLTALAWDQPIAIPQSRARVLLVGKTTKVVNKLDI